MTDIEIAEKILIANGWQLDFLVSTYYKIPVGGIGTPHYQTESGLAQDPKGTIAFWGYDWDTECLKLGIRQPLSFNGVPLSSNPWSSQPVILSEERGIEFTKDKERCAHVYVSYVGLREVYDYCRICDRKKFVK